MPIINNSDLTVALTRHPETGEIMFQVAFELETDQGQEIHLISMSQEQYRIMLETVNAAWLALESLRERGAVTD